MTRDPLASAVEDVVSSGRCTGCGACSRLDSRLDLALDSNGFARPRLGVGPARPPRQQATRANTFRQMCPGIVVAAPQAPRHQLFGAALGVWQAWATDRSARFEGSSGGAITALNQWLLATGRVTQVFGVSAREGRPTQSAPAVASDSAQALKLSGSRYAPSPSLARGEVFRGDTVVVAKPCEASAVRGLQEDGEAPVLISFFCAGVPSQKATDRLAAELGVPVEQAQELRYRGRGWPGNFTVRAADGTEASVTYDESWGKALGPTVQWRCKLCPDGVGEAADIVAGDYWESDERGYPVFAEGDGRSVVIARTPRGLRILEDAFAAGVIAGEPLSLDELTPVQPLQVERRTVLLGRLLGARMARVPVPRYRGFGLWRLALRHPVRNARAAKGTLTRARAARDSEERAYWQAKANKEGR